MLKNKLYSYVEKYINEYLYVFTKEQLDVGLTNGTISLEYLNLRPDKVNSKLDEKNLPIWLKAGLISKISVGLSLMNFIGEQPLDVTIDGIDVIVTPSYKWIIKNLESFIEENETHIKDYYDTNERIENFNNDIVHEKGETKRKVYYDKSYVFYNRNYDEKRFYTSGGVEVNEKIEKILQDILIDISPEYYEFIDKQRLELDKFIPGLFDKLVRKTLIYKDNYELGCLLDVNRKNIKKIKYTK